MISWGYSRRAPRPSSPPPRRRFLWNELEPGDLLFFRIKGRISHVAIYTGEGRFVHAPQTGRPGRAANARR